MCQFNAVEIKGDPINKGMLIGVAQVFGCLFVSRLADLVPDYIGVIIAYCIMMVVSSVMQLSFAGEYLIYGCLII